MNKQINKLFRALFEYQRIRQSQVAKNIHISQPALSQFLAGESSLSISTLKKIAPLLSLNPNYIEDMNANPFGDGNFFKMIIPEKYSLLPDLSLVDLLLDLNDKVRLIFLSPPLLSLVKFTMGRESPIYAIAVKDGDGNCFLFRRKQKSPLHAIIVGEEALKNKIDRIANKGRSFLHETKVIDKELYLKIRNWEAVEKADIEPLFDTTEVLPPKLTDEQMQVINKMTELNIPASELLKYIQNIATTRDHNKEQ
ncbi:MAG: helix-turn-helix transcriptional regulator [Nitrospirae bacterium]|nr:helix-turn-helix transcriptional regulator [Nitrospirota bacterium]